MSSSDALFEASSVYFQNVNERAARVKIDRVSRRCRLGPQGISNFGWFSTTVVL